MSRRGEKFDGIPSGIMVVMVSERNSDNQESCGAMTSKGKVGSESVSYKTCSAISVRAFLSNRHSLGNDQTLERAGRDSKK